MGSQRVGHDWVTSLHSPWKKKLLVHVSIPPCLGNAFWVLLLLEFNRFTVLSWFLSYNSVNQLYVSFLCSLPLHHPPPPGHHRAPSWAPHVIRQLPSSHLVYMWQCMSVSAILPICPTLPIPPCPMSILYSCISIPALQISSSLPFF